MSWIRSLIARLAPSVAQSTELGANVDTRPPEEVEKDYLLKEIVASTATVSWAQKRWEEFRRFGVQNQDGSSSCVWQTIRKLMRIIFMVNRGQDLDFSATFGYRERANYPAGGTGAIDALNYAAEKGVTLNALMPSDDLSELEMNGAKIQQYHRDVAALFNVPNYVQLPVGDLETVVSTIQKTGKGVMLWYYFTAEEWSRQVPEVLDPSISYPGHPNALRHSVAGVDGGRLVGFASSSSPSGITDKKGVFIEDSAHFGGFSERFITEEFHRARNWFAAYQINFSFDEGATPRPSHRFDVDMRPGDTNDEVKALQDVLKFEGLFPTNVDSTGYFGAITKKAAVAFQAKHGISPTSGLVLTLTRSKLNELYGA